MFKFTFTAGLTVLLFFSNCLARSRGVGLGIIVGDPTGLSGKLWLGNDQAVDGAVAWNSHGENLFYLHADYLVHNFELIEVKKGQLPFYYGIGLRAKFQEEKRGENDDKIGIRVPVGLNYIFERAPIDVFAEVVPLLDLVPDTEFHLNGAIGVRFFFGQVNTQSGKKHTKRKK
ncbi:MAG: hypothetical protein ABII74_01090 [Elusimicrobiota bacterium]